MGIQIRWDNSGRVPEGTVVFWEFGESWTWADFRQREQETYAWQVNSIPRTIHTIVDMRRSRGMSSVDAISSIVYNIQQRPPNRGKVAVVGANRLILLLESAIRRLVPDLSAAYVLVDSLDEAYDLILGEINRQNTDAET